MTVLLLFSSLFFTLAADEGQDRYGNTSDYLEKLYGTDDNAGLTAFPVLNIPMGGRSEGMAGAFAAVADDISFLEYNPAGSSMLEKTEIAFFHNNWIADTKIESAAFAIRIKNLGIAAGLKWLHTPFTEYNIYGERVSGGHYSEGVAIANVSYNFLSGYYFAGFSFGINLKAAFRILPDFTDNFDNIISDSGKSQSGIMGMADVGFLTRFNFLKGYKSREKNFSVAAVIRNLGPPVKEEPLPTVFNAAIAYKPVRPLTISLDFCLPINMLDFKLSEKPYGALGLSVNITRFLSLRAGVMYKPGSSRLNVGSAITLKRVALDINYSLDLLSQKQFLNRISLGVRLNLGDRGRNDAAAKVDELYLLGMEAYAAGKFADARLCWEEAVRLSPRYDPAIEALAMMNERGSLIQKIDDLQRLDF